MSRTDRARVWTLAAGACVAVLVAAGCGGEGGGGGGEMAEEGGMEQVENPVDPATAGTITGRVTFTGTPPAAEAIDMAGEQVCLDKHDGPPMKPLAVVGPEGGLGDVFVYVKSGAAIEGLEFPTPSDAVVLDQDGCIYHPHVMGLSTGQTLTVHNSDDVLHNINATPEQNRGFNRSQPTSGMEFETSFAVPEVMIPVRCDVHGWMSAYIGVTANPYHGVTGEDGSFTLADLPPGEYEVEAWHERYGTSTQMVTVPESGEVEVTFEFDEQMAGRHVPLAPALVVDHAEGTLRRVASPSQQ